ncbi:MAG: type I glyceraldehyde-3-phosphate dehydrogenase [Candidatus Terrybacteria bacterium RIFCSPHIGHO2_01_FULL_48_17]|uniref:Type I glyceraldehyde-3-phosphate dehydrogenase n=1 Tax=Candidatus Terrybacteria bacterium RIFCSPHIGHO2_01_FULL_48_17 TaxID=1802362 RepID=A0A1G2PIP1_9BACT|nr:MAG: type I glyceraldehyde-3-phosphate dehydrogenase [Candidatus Terrybacteria bacterium RIFCSPHIGHO2_01_FULL_48_17]OHA53850.1 MAG: type I glyceraldehyde-3-phosphate dehydrogenase [Candidatus Terrybacteria bacterium RIFCSPLOWO2_01_FULL_48_14]
MIRVAINGFGRIGRAFFRQAFDRTDIEIVAINDLGDFNNLAYLLKYDTVYGRWNKVIETIPDGNNPSLIIQGKKILTFAEREPEKLPWKELEIDVVVEATGVFASEEGGKKHLAAGAKRVVISAPAKGNVEHVLIGANDERFQDTTLGAITANASCTTNASVPPMAVLMEYPGVAKGILQTVHAYTATQTIVDGPGGKGDFRRGRAAAQNIIPAHTGAADAVVKSLPSLDGIFDGLAIRVPVPVGSLSMLTILAKRKTSVDEINNHFRKAVQQPRWKGILEITEEQIVSSDIIGTTAAAIVDLTFTRVVDGDLVTVFSWYDNEWAYSHTLIEHVLRVGKRL